MPIGISELSEVNKNKVVRMIVFLFRIQIIKDHCMQFIVKDENFSDVVMSSEFSDLDKPLLVEIIRKRLNPSKANTDANLEKNVGKFFFFFFFVLNHLYVYFNSLLVT